MEIAKKTLAQLQDAYATGLINVGGEERLVVGPETKGKPLMFNPSNWTNELTFPEKLGGCMNVRPFSETEDSFFAIEGFYPVFQSEGAGVVYVSRNSDGNWQKRRVLDLPFVHRIEVVTVAGDSYLVASALAESKDSPEDWSSPGATYVGIIPDNPEDGLEMSKVLSGIHKNHGLHVTELKGKEMVLITGQEGVFALIIPDNHSTDWESRKLIGHEVSDISVMDLDLDGDPELVTIEPFHGDTLGLYGNSGEGWEQQTSYPLDFGHVVWTGEIQGHPRIIAGSRGGKEDLVCLKWDESSGDLKEDFVIDQGVGPAQITVLQKPDLDIVFSANNGADEVAMYRIRSET